MPLPLIAKVGSAVAGLVSGLGQKRASKKMLREQQQLAAKQTGYADAIAQAVQDLMRQSPSMLDAYGSGSVYDPVTGTWRAQLSDRDRAIQDASDIEELERLTGDQAISRQGLYGAERIRQGAEGASGLYLQDLLGMREGRGAVDPTQVLRDIIARRTAAVDAAYDEVQRGLRSQSMRTGASDTAQLRRLAQLRAQDIARTMGVPEVEALEIADRLNQARNQSLLGNYGTMVGIGSNIVDRGFMPSQRNVMNFQGLFDTRKLDLARTGLGLEGSAAAAGIVSNAARNLFGARAGAQQMAPPNPVGGFIGTLGQIFGGRTPAPPSNIVVSNYRAPFTFLRPFGS